MEESDAQQLCFKVESKGGLYTWRSLRQQVTRIRCGVVVDRMMGGWMALDLNCGKKNLMKGVNIHQNSRIPHKDIRSKRQKISKASG
jgi:hypothetical protein